MHVSCVYTNLCKQIDLVIFNANFVLKVTWVQQHLSSFLWFIPFTCREANMNKLMRLIVGCLVIVAMVKFFYHPRWGLQFSWVSMCTCIKPCFIVPNTLNLLWPNLFIHLFLAQVARPTKSYKVGNSGLVHSWMWLIIKRILSKKYKTTWRIIQWKKRRSSPTKRS